jgi:hypothetical protein
MEWTTGGESPSRSHCMASVGIKFHTLCALWSLITWPEVWSLITWPEVWSLITWPEVWSLIVWPELCSVTSHMVKVRRMALTYPCDARYIITCLHSIQAMTHVIKQLHSRDTRLHYCPPEHWLSSKVELQVDLVRTKRHVRCIPKKILELYFSCFH